MYKACILDMDGTLLNTLEALAYLGNKALKSMNLPPIETLDYQKMVGNGVHNLIKRALAYAGAQVTPENTALFYKLYTEPAEEEAMQLIAPYEGILELLRALKADGVRLEVLSNKPHAMTCLMAETFFPGIFSCVQGQQEGLPIKPDPTALLSIIQTFHLAKEDALYCGDSDVDMQTAYNAGVTGAGAAWGFRGREELAANGAAYIAEQPLDLYEIVMQTKKSLSMRIL